MDLAVKTHQNVTKVKAKAQEAAVKMETTEAGQAAKAKVGQATAPACGSPVLSDPLYTCTCLLPRLGFGIKVAAAESKGKELGGGIFASIKEVCSLRLE